MVPSLQSHCTMRHWSEELWENSYHRLTDTADILRSPCNAFLMCLWWCCVNELTVLPFVWSIVIQLCILIFDNKWLCYWFMYLLHCTISSLFRSNSTYKKFTVKQSAVVAATASHISWFLKLLIASFSLVTDLISYCCIHQGLTVGVRGYSPHLSTYLSNIA